MVTDPIADMLTRIRNANQMRNKEVEIPAELQAQAEEYRNNLIEAVADYDEELMMTYLDGGEVSVEA